MYFNVKYGMYYIGCAINLCTRQQNHISALKRGTHHNIKMQNIYNKYKEEPIFEILEYCNTEELHNKEIDYINRFDSFNSGYNLTLGGEGGSYGENNVSAKHLEIDYYKVLCSLVYSKDPYSTISEKTGVSVSIIKQISRMKSHFYLKEKFPTEYSILESKYLTRNNSAKYKGVTYPSILSPQGTEYTVENIHKFAEEHGLQYQNLHKVLTKQRLSHKGWKLVC